MTIEKPSDGTQQIASFLSLPAWGGEDFERFWGHVNYKDKVVLDIGADYGSTASFFLKKGASRVIAVEGNKEYFDRLKANAKDVPSVVPVERWVKTPKQFEELILEYEPDILKADCEGCEVHLADVQNSIFSKVPSYVLEVHSETIWGRLNDKFKGLKYEIVHKDKWCPAAMIIHAKRK